MVKRDRGLTLSAIGPRTMASGNIEAFSGQLRLECLNVAWFLSALALVPMNAIRSAFLNTPSDSGDGPASAVLISVESEWDSFFFEK